MRYGLIVFGLFFLVNPYFWIIDVLPDFIGLLLIAKAISPIVDASPSAEEASTNFKKAAAVSIAQCGLLIPLISIVNSDVGFNMVFSFCFNILKLIFLIPAFRQLFDSFEYFAQRHAGEGKSVSIGRIKLTRIATGLFLMLHAFLSAFPDIVYFMVDDSGFTENIYPLASYRLGVTVLCAAASLIVSVVWYCIITPHMFSLKRNVSLNIGINSDIALAVRSEKKRVMSAVSPAILCYTASLFCMISYFVDGKSAIPVYFAPILHIAAIVFANKVTARKRVTKAFSIIALILSLPLQLFYEAFSSSYHERALFDFNGVKDQFMIPLIFNILFTAFLILSLICVGIALHRIIEEHTGLYWEKEFITHNARAAREKLRNKRLSAALTFALCLSAVINTVSYLNLYKKPMFNLYATVICLVISLITSFLYANVKNAVIEKYSTENKMT